MTEPPRARYAHVSGKRAFIMCPYCGKGHSHPLYNPGRQWRAPACGMYRSSDERATGYTFTIPPEDFQ